MEFLDFRELRCCKGSFLSAVFMFWPYESFSAPSNLINVVQMQKTVLKSDFHLRCTLFEQIKGENGNLGTLPLHQVLEIGPHTGNLDGCWMLKWLFWVKSLTGSHQHNRNYMFMVYMAMWNTTQWVSCCLWCKKCQKTQILPFLATSHVISWHQFSSNLIYSN